MTPEEYKQRALEQMKTASGPWDRGEEPGLNELSGFDVLREPKQKLMDTVGPGSIQNLINMLMPEEIGLPSMKATGAGMAAVGVIKPKTKAKDLMTESMKIWDKDKVSDQIGNILGGDVTIPNWKKKLMDEGKSVVKSKAATDIYNK